MTACYKNFTTVANKIAQSTAGFSEQTLKYMYTVHAYIHVFTYMYVSQLKQNTNTYLGQ